MGQMATILPMPKDPRIVIRMKMRGIVIFSLFATIGLANSCNAQKINNPICDEKKELVIQFISSELKRLKLNKKTIHKQIVFNVANAQNSSIKELFSDGYFGLIQNFKNSTEEDVIHFDNEFDDNEYDFLKNQISCHKTKNWSAIVGNKYFNNQEEVELEGISYSIPVFSKGGKYGFVYVESKYSGALKVYKMVEGNWEYFAQSTIWIE